MVSTPCNLCIKRKKRRERGEGEKRERGKKGREVLNDGRNFDLPKLMPVEHISLMPSSCLSLTNTRQGTRQQVTQHGSANQEFINEQKGLLIAGVPYHLSPIPLFYPFLPMPYPFRCLLRGLCSLVKFV